MGQACSDEGVTARSGSDAMRAYEQSDEQSSEAAATNGPTPSDEESGASDKTAVREFTAYYSEGVTVASLVVLGSSTVISGGDDGLVQAFDIVAGKVTRRWKGHGRGVTDLSVAGSVLASSSRDKLVHFWSLDGLVGGEGGAGGAGEGQGAGAEAAAAAASVGRSRLVLVDPATHLKTLISLPLCVCIPPSGAALDPIRTLKGHKMSVSAVALSPDGSSAVSGSRGGAMMLWDAKTGTKKWRSQIARNIVTCTEWVPGSTVIVQGSEDLSLRLWDSKGGVLEVLVQLRAFTYFPVSLAVSPDGLLAVTGSRGVNGTGGELRLWNLKKIREEVKAARDAPGALKVDGAKLCSDRAAMAEFAGHGEDVVGVAFDHQQKDGEGGDSINEISVFSASKDGTARAWTCPGFGGAAGVVGAAGAGAESGAGVASASGAKAECVYLNVPANHAALTALASLPVVGGASSSSSAAGTGKARVVIASRGGLAIV